MSPKRIRWLLAGALLLALSGIVSSARADGPISSAYFGMDDGGVVTKRAENFDLIKGVGASYLRISLYWKWIEPAPTSPENFNWGYPDSYLLPIRDGGMTPLVFISENPAWAASTTCGPIDTTNPVLLAEFAEFMGGLATHYPYVKTWVMYNEADHSRGESMTTGGCFGDHKTGDINSNGVPDSAEYAEMTAAARIAVHQANPDALVGFAIAFDDFDSDTCPPGYPGGCPPLSHFNYYFLPNLMNYIAAHPRTDGQPYADFVSFTYYDIYGPFWERQTSGVGWHGIQAKAAAIRQRMRDAGVNMPLLVTETGDDSQPSWLGLDGQSKCLTMTFVRGLAADLKAVTWWTFADHPLLNWYYGIVDVDFNPKPSYTAYQRVAQELSGWTFESVRRKQPTVEVYSFRRDGKRKFVAWSADVSPGWVSPCARQRTPQTFQLNAKRVLVLDMYGKGKVYKDNKGNDFDPRKKKMKILVDGTPRFITQNP